MTTDPKDAEIARYDLDLMESRMVKDQWGGEWVRYSDHVAEITRLRMALAESEAAAEGALMILMQTRAERDAALAQVADTVRKVWGRCEAMEDEAYAKLEGQIENDHERGFWTAQKMVAKSIRRSAEMPSNALAALSRRDAKMRAEGRKEGLQEAADVCVCIRQDPETAEEEAIGAMMCASAILAAAEKEAGNG